MGWHLKLLGRWWFWIGNQGWEYLELGRIWQYLLAIGLLVWFALLWWVARPAKVENVEARPIVRMFFVAALSSPLFYLPALFFGAKTNYTVVDTGASGLSIYGSRASLSFSQRRSWRWPSTNLG